MPTLRRWVCLALPFAAACTSDPNAPLSKLSRLPPPTVRVSPTADALVVEISGDVAARGCIELDDDFQAEVAGTAVPIVDRGESVGSALGGDPCIWPAFRLEHPPAAADATLVMQFGGHTITAGLGDRLVPRTLQPVPAGPWRFTPQQAISARWSPPGDLAGTLPLLEFIPEPAGSPGDVLLAATVAGDQLSFQLPATLGMGRLEITLRPPAGDEIALPCAGASCALVPRPLIVQPIDIHAAAAR